MKQQLSLLIISFSQLAQAQTVVGNGQQCDLFNNPAVAKTCKPGLTCSPPPRVPGEPAVADGPGFCRLLVGVGQKW